jgi:surface carbohydrate biosynthesis protein
MIKKFKGLKWISYQKVDILIIDKHGYEWIKKCLPTQANHIMIPYGSIPILVRLKYFILIALNLLKGETKFFLFCISLVEALEPKVIISFNDNNNFMGDLQEKLPDKLVISVQNGARVDHAASTGGWDEYTHIPHYYGFGDYEKSLMLEKGVRIREYIKAGSLKLGLVLSEIDSKQNEEYDICFISAFRHKKIQAHQEIVEPMLKTQKLLFSTISGICACNNYSLAVAMTYDISSENYDIELDYYRAGIDYSHIQFLPNNRTRFDSYHIGFSSKLVIALWSTLSIELFGTGKRAIFGGISHTQQKDIGAKLFENMPSEVLLYEQGEDHIGKKIEVLLNMADNEYLKKTAFARDYYMRCERPYPHEMIKKRIAEHLNAPVE